ncbi:MAG: hypothetical protein ACHQWU_02255 [Gemmatimonadales bacterium]
MRRSLAVRIVLALWSLWFVALVGEVPGADPCPVHGHHAGHMAMPMPSAQGGHDASDANGKSAPGRTPICTCLGACCCCAPISLAHQSSAAVTVAARASEPPRHVAIVAPRAPQPHILPFANAPPATPVSAAL